MPSWLTAASTPALTFRSPTIRLPTASSRCGTGGAPAGALEAGIIGAAPARTSSPITPAAWLPILPIPRANIFVASFDSCIPQTAWRAAEKATVSCRTARRSWHHCQGLPEAPRGLGEGRRRNAAGLLQSRRLRAGTYADVIAVRRGGVVVRNDRVPRLTDHG